MIFFYKTRSIQIQSVHSNTVSLLYAYCIELLQTGKKHPFQFTHSSQASCPVKEWLWASAAQIGASETWALEKFRGRRGRLGRLFASQAHRRRMTSGVHFHIVNDASFDFQCDLNVIQLSFRTAAILLHDSVWKSNQPWSLHATDSANTNTHIQSFQNEGSCWKDFTPLIHGFVTLCPAAMPFHWVVLEHFGPSYLSVHTRGTQCNMRDGASGPWSGLLASLELRFHGNPSLWCPLNISFSKPFETLKPKTS